MMDCRQITFVTLNGFSQLSKKLSALPPILNRKYQDGLKKRASFTLYFKFYIRGYYFLQLFTTLFNIIWKRIFVTNFLILTDSPKSLSTMHTPSLNSQFPLSVTKVYSKCSPSFEWVINDLLSCDVLLPIDVISDLIKQQWARRIFNLVRKQQCVKLLNKTIYNIFWKKNFFFEMTKYMDS